MFNKAFLGILLTATSALAQPVHGDLEQMSRLLQPQRDASNQLALAAELCESREYARALLIYQELLKRDPKNFEALYRVGWIENQQKRFEEALGSLAVANATRAHDSSCLSEIGYTHRRLGHAEEAIVIYNEAIQADKENPWAWRGLGDVYFDLRHDYAQALKAYHNALKLSPKDPHISYRYGWCACELGQFKDAEPHLRVACRAEKDSFSANFELGYCSLRLAQFEQARVAFERASSIKPEDATTHYYLGGSYWHLGHADEANHQLAMLQTLSPELARNLSELMQNKSGER